MLSKNKIRRLKENYKKDGFVLVKNFLPKSECTKALSWLNKKNKKKLAKTWTEQEPGVDLAVFFIIHNKLNNPISKLANNKKVLSLASELFSRYPKYDEGKLATIFSFLTSAIIHEKISKDIELDIYLKNKGFNISTKVSNTTFTCRSYSCYNYVSYRVSSFYKRYLRKI